MAADAARFVPRRVRAPRRGLQRWRANLSGRAARRNVWSVSAPESENLVDHVIRDAETVAKYDVAGKRWRKMSGQDERAPAGEALAVVAFVSLLVDLVAFIAALRNWRGWPFP